MNLVWSPEAIDDLIALRAYIEGENPSAARRIALRIVEALEDAVLTSPGVGRPGRIPGTRELVVSGTPFIVPYRVEAGTLHVLRIYHAARKWPERF